MLTGILESLRLVDVNITNPMNHSLGASGLRLSVMDSLAYQQRIAEYLSFLRASGLGGFLC